MSTFTIPQNFQSRIFSRFFPSVLVSLCTNITRLFRHIGKVYERAEMVRKESYLAAAVDLYDLDYRMRCLDRESAQTVAWIKGF